MSIFSFVKMLRFIWHLNVWPTGCGWFIRQTCFLDFKNCQIVYFFPFLRGGMCWWKKNNNNSFLSEWGRTFTLIYLKNSLRKGNFTTTTYIQRQKSIICKCFRFWEQSPKKGTSPSPANAIVLSRQKCKNHINLISPQSCKTQNTQSLLMKLVSISPFLLETNIILEGKKLKRQSLSTFSCFITLVSTFPGNSQIYVHTKHRTDNHFSCSDLDFIVSWLHWNRFIAKRLSLQKNVTSAGFSGTILCFRLVKTQSTGCAFTNRPMPYISHILSGLPGPPFAMGAAPPSVKHGAPPARKCFFSSVLNQLANQCPPMNRGGGHQEGES